MSATYRSTNSKNTYKNFVVVLTVCLLGLSGCLQTENSSSVDDVETVDGSELFKAANSVLKNKCAQCHQGYAEDEASLLEQGVVVPGFPESSTLFTALIGSTGVGRHDMPLNGSMTSTEIDTIAEWITNMAGQ